MSGLEDRMSQETAVCVVNTSSDWFNTTHGQTGPDTICFSHSAHNSIVLTHIIGNVHNCYIHSQFRIVTQNSSTRFVFFIHLITLLWVVILGTDPPENCHLTVKKMPKKVIFFKKNAICNFVEKMTIFVNFFLKKLSSFCKFFNSQMAIFRRVR